MKEIVKEIKGVAGEDAETALEESDDEEVEVLEEVEMEETEVELETVCSDNSGNWLDDYSECEGLSQEKCEESGGVYNECESACRHDENADVCTLQCVAVCVYS